MDRYCNACYHGNADVCGKVTIIYSFFFGGGNQKSFVVVVIV